MIKRVFIANRGEIALRILRACRELDIDTVAPYSKADEDALHVQLAGQSICIGGAPVGESYLNQNALITAALAMGCDAVHPGYGLLSENKDFAQLCTQHGLIFIGPSAHTIALSGDKAEARRRMVEAGVPVTPGSDGILRDVEDGLKIAEEIGYPVLLKAASGGGGRGIRPVHSPQELPTAFQECQMEARACFGSDAMYLEKLIVNPRHIEVQILADRHGHVISLGERDCSVQRKNQKLIEESPATGLSLQLRQAMGQAAIDAAKAVDYENAGTVEFLLTDTGAFYFMEMNTRIQVEHGVTELVTGVDLVKEQLRIASGLPLSVTEVPLIGHAIECRINGENPKENFRPNAGTVEFLHFPTGTGVRIDSALYTGYTVPPYYDSLVAKILVHAPTRLEAIRRMRRALEEFTLEGFDTNCDLSHQILYHPTFVRGKYNTSFLEIHLEELLRWSGGEGAP